MVSLADFEFRRSVHSAGGIDSLGGRMDTTQNGLIDAKQDNNIFTTAPTAEVVAGSIKYRIIYCRYIGTETPLKNCSFAEFFGTKPNMTAVNWAFDPSPHKYQYEPHKDFNGSSDFEEVADADNLDLVKFSVSAWFNTSTNYSTDGVILVKGATANANYTLHINSSEQIVGGFHDSGVNPHLATSPSSYNDSEWHFAVVTYDQITVRLYIDGVEVATHATTTTPQTNSSVLSIGRRSGVGLNWWTGSLDEIRVWNNNLTSTEISNLYNSNIEPQSDNVVYERHFGEHNGSRIAQKLTNETTGPTGGPIWQKPTSDVPDPPNIGEFSKNEYFPIIIRYTIVATSPAPSIEDDTSSFRVYYNIQPGQTGNPSEEGGGSEPDDFDDLTIIFNSDWDGNSKTGEMVSLAQSRNPNVVISGGDNSYSSSEKKFFDRIKPIDDNQDSSIRFETAIGNHDDEDNKLEETMDHFHYKKSYHAFTMENVRILFLDSENSPTGSAQVTFGETSLKEGRASDKIDWLIVVFHRPIYTANSKHDPDESDMRTTWHPLFEKYQVDLVLQGHNHNIQRTFPLKNKGDNSPKITTTSQGPYNNKDENWNGTIFCINGTGGHDSGGSLYDLDNTPSFNAYQSNSYNGHLELKTSNNGKTLTCKFINEDGKTKHSWTMTR